MKRILEQYKKIPPHNILLVFLILTLLMIPFDPAHAQDAIDRFTANAVLSLLAGVVNFFTGVVVASIAWIGQGLDMVLKAKVTDVAVVRSSWELIRNFANMFFIIILIIMAFGTIFNIRGYEFRSLIVNFIIAALLINFSLAIGELIIGIVQSFSTILLTAIGDVGTRLAQDSSIATIVANHTADSSGNLVLQWVKAVDQLITPETIGNFLSKLTSDSIEYRSTVVAVLDLAIASIFMFSLGVAFVFTLIRIPILWALLIVSPIAWITYILPTTRRINRMWWDYFLSWNLFLPIYLFFLYFGSLILSQRKEVVSSIFSGSSAGSDTLAGLGLDFQLLFFYILIAIFTIGGAKYAISSSRAGGAGIVAGAIWARGRAATKWGGRLAARPITVPAEYARKAVEEKASMLQQRMFTEPGQVTGSRIAGTFGAQKLSDDAMSKAVTGAKQRLQKITDIEKLRSIAQTGNTNEKIAALELIDERFGGLTTADEAISLYNLYGGAASQNAQKALAKLDPKKFSKEDRDRLYEIGDLRLKQKIADVRAEKGEFIDVDDFILQSTIFTSEGDKVDFAKKAKNYLEGLRPDQRKAIYNATTSKELKKELAVMLAEKGDFGKRDKDGKIIEGTVLAELKEAAAQFEGKNQMEALLNKAKGKNLIAALQAKRDLNIFPDANKTQEEQYTTEMEREVSRLDNDEILEQSKEALADESFQKALIKSLSEKRIGAITRSHKADASRLEILNEKVFSQIRINAVNIDKLKPLTDYVERIKTLAAQVSIARVAQDQERLNLLKKESLEIQKKASKLLDDILGQPFATFYQKETAKKQMDEIKSQLDSLRRFDK